MSVRVVLVDDEAMVRVGLRMVLSAEADLEVVGEAANGRDAVDVTVAARPDVVLLDMTMPVMDGPDAAAEISRLAPGTRIVMLSGWPADEVRSRLGPDVTVVVKGMGPMEVIEAVRRATGRPGTEPA